MVFAGLCVFIFSCFFLCAGFSLCVRVQTSCVMSLRSAVNHICSTSNITSVLRAAVCQLLDANTGFNQALMNSSYLLHKAPTFIYLKVFLRRMGVYINVDEKKHILRTESPHLCLVFSCEGNCKVITLGVNICGRESGICLK